MATLTKAERDKLPRSSYADPDRRLYPILSASDVMAASMLLGKAPKERQAAIKARIITIAKRKGFPLPKMWESM